MIEVTLRIVAANEEALRRAMDEVFERAMAVDGEAQMHERNAAAESKHERVAKKHEQLAQRRRAVAKVLDAIADAIDHAEPRIIR